MISIQENTAVVAGKRSIGNELLTLNENETYRRRLLGQRISARDLQNRQETRETKSHFPRT